MDNPYEEAQTVIITRILGNIEKLNESFLELNRAVAQTNVYNASTSEVVELWSTYVSNLRFNLASSRSLEPPL